jgi:ADP-ribose pyrophosphatase YjhB (NUDIX family)
VPRTEFYYDPEAPAPNSIVVAVTAFAQDDQGRVLLIHRTDNDFWALPGGAQDVGETITETVARETREETGIDVKVTGLIGIYSNPKHVIAYSDGEIRQEFSICFRAKPTGGKVRPSNESSEVCWVEQERLDDLSIHPSMRLRIDHGFARLTEPYLS